LFKLVNSKNKQKLLRLIGTQCIRDGPVGDVEARRTTSVSRRQLAFCGRSWSTPRIAHFTLSSASTTTTTDVCRPLSSRSFATKSRKRKCDYALYVTVGHSPGTSRLDFELLLPKVRSLEVKGQFFRITPFKFVIQSRQKFEYNLFNSLILFIYLFICP